MTEVKVRKGEPVERALRRLKKRLDREQTLQQCDRLESDKARLMQKEKELNDRLIQATMQAKTREGEQTMRIQQLQHEVAYQKTRVDALHGEYQKRIAQSGPSGSAAAAVMGGGNATATDAVVRSGSEAAAAAAVVVAGGHVRSTSRGSGTSGAAAAAPGRSEVDDAEL